MDIGFYRLKNKFREWMKIFLPHLKDADPNLLSWMILPVSFFTILFFVLARKQSVFYLLAIAFIFLRMVFATLDGYVAATFNKSTHRGEFLNRFVPELSDTLLLSSLLYMFHASLMLSCLVLITAWMSSYLGIVGAAVKAQTTSVGPVGQTDRLVALMFFSLGMFFNQILSLNLNFMKYFFYWCVLGGILTILNRLLYLYKHTR